MSASSTLAAVAVCLACVACASPRTGYTLRVTIAPDANDRAPVPVDVVFVWDKNTAGKVGGLTAADWFASKPQFRHDDPDHKALTICEWEWVPGQAVPEINLAIPAAARRWAHGVYVFTKYRTAGTHRSSLAPGVTSLLELGRDDATLRSVGSRTSDAYAWVDERCPAVQPPDQLPS